MKTICFYHKSDLDGKCSGAIVKHNIPDAILVGIDHGDPFPWSLIDKFTIVYMCDFSLPDMNLMYRLWEKSHEFIWIDHHKSAIEKYNEFCTAFYEMNRISWNLDGSRYIGKSGCELTYEWFHPNEKIPRFIELLGAYDTWRNSDIRWNNVIVPFQYGMQAKFTNPEINMGIWYAYFHDSKTSWDKHQLLNETIERGNIILDYLIQKNSQNVERTAYEAIFDNLRAICVNSDHSSSVLDSIYDPEIHDIVVIYTHQKDSWYVSLYSTKDSVDCSKLAVKYGGGGHAGAAGFRIPNNQNLPWSIV